MQHQTLRTFAAHLRNQERCPSTITSYLRAVTSFLQRLGGRKLTRECAIEWKRELVERGLKTKTINVMLSALNAYLNFRGLDDLRLQHLTVQAGALREAGRELDEDEALRLCLAAKRHSKRLYLIAQTMAATGMRVSELEYVTIEAVEKKAVVVNLKRKVRQVVIKDELAVKLLAYAEEQGIKEGPIFITKSGKPMSRQQIWRELKSLSGDAYVAKTKVFPHNLRHVFAMRFYRITQDITMVANVLGHSSIETTRIYLTSSIDTMTRAMNSLPLLC